MGFEHTYQKNNIDYQIVTKSTERKPYQYQGFALTKGQQRTPEDTSLPEITREHQKTPENSSRHELAKWFQSK